ncbi:hypothetical protein I4U23_000528 [Adineta vaga]|nr:hypothetical protein I4U23_000528 [Adineta vaga]
MEEYQEDIRRREGEIQSICHDAEITGIQTIRLLNHQNEQFENIISSLTTVDTALVDTKQNINRLKGVTRRVIDSVRTKLHRKVFSKILLNSTKKQNFFSTSSPRTRDSSPKLLRHNIPSTKSFSDGPIDRSLDNIENAIQRLKGIALEINVQLTDQADTINDIHEKMTNSTISIEQQNIDMKKIFS